MFLYGRELVEVKPWSGKLETMCTLMNINTVSSAVEDYCHQLVQALTKDLKISWESIRQILMGKLEIKRVCLTVGMGKIDNFSYQYYR